MMMMLTSKLLDGFQNSMDLLIILLSKLCVKQNLMDLMIMLTKQAYLLDNHNLMELMTKMFEKISDDDDAHN